MMEFVEALQKGSIEALQKGSIEAIRKCPKADLHNHFVLGGSRNYLKEHTGREIQPITKPR